MPQHPDGNIPDQTPKDDKSANLPKDGVIKPDFANECEHCRSERLDQKILQAFGRRLCSACRHHFPLISQTAAMEDYLVSKGDLAYLPRIEVENPRSFMWRSMLLYSKEAVAEISARRFPDLEAEKQRRVKASQRTKNRRLKQKIASLKKSARPRTATEDKHTHDFDSDGRCECGLKIHQEEL